MWLSQAGRCGASYGKDGNEIWTHVGWEESLKENGVFCEPIKQNIHTRARDKMPYHLELFE